MKYYVACFLVAVFLLVGFASAEELTIKDFPLGKGMSYVDSVLAYYSQDLKPFADTVKSDSTVNLKVTGRANGDLYQEEHDANNAGTSLSRAHGLQWIFVNVFDVDSARIIIDTEESREKTGDGLTATVAVVPRFATINDLNAVIAMIPDVPEKVVCTTYVQDTIKEQSKDQTTLQVVLGALSFGVSTLPKADIIFLVHAEVKLDEKLTLFGTFGHSLLDNVANDAAGNPVDASAMLTNVGITYLVWEAESTDSTSTLKSIGLSAMLTQMQNDKDYNDTHLWKRRTIEVGPKLNFGIATVGIYGNYGKTKEIHSPSVVWNGGGRIELTVQPF